MERKVDKLGRVVLPKSYRDKLGLCVGDELTFELHSESIVISKTASMCSLCSKNIDNKSVVKLCKACILKVKSL